MAVLLRVQAPLEALAAGCHHMAHGVRAPLPRGKQHGRTHILPRLARLLLPLPLLRLICVILAWILLLLLSWLIICWWLLA
jgi:hypothetical protein